MNQAMTDQVNPKDYPGKDVYAVIGNPIAHSKSPLIHEIFAKQTNQAIHYGRIFSELNDFKKSTLEFCGVKPVKVTYIGPIRNSKENFRIQKIAQVEKLGLLLK